MYFANLNPAVTPAAPLNLHAKVANLRICELMDVFLYALRLVLDYPSMTRVGEPV